jgi:hypothetical protein
VPRWNVFAGSCTPLRQDSVRQPYSLGNPNRDETFVLLQSRGNGCSSVRHRQLQVYCLSGTGPPLCCSTSGALRSECHQGSDLRGMSLQCPSTDVLQGTRTRELYRLVLFADKLSKRNNLPGVVLHLCYGQRPNSSTYERIPAAGRLTRPRTAYVLRAYILNKPGVLITCRACATERHARSMLQVDLWLRSDKDRNKDKTNSNVSSEHDHCSFLERCTSLQSLRALSRPDFPKRRCRTTYRHNSMVALIFPTS